MRTLLPVLNVLGLIMALFSLTMLVPIGMAWYFQDGALRIFSLSLVGSATAGFLLYSSTRMFRRELRPRDGFLLVTLVWSVLPLLAACPLYWYFWEQGQPLSFTDAYFEAMSGLTTTGSTVLNELDKLPHAINAWRSSLTWMGGMGVLVLAVAILPMLGTGGSQIFRAETPGPMKDEKLTPRITGTAKGLYAIYLLVSLSCMLGYRMAGMSWFDAYCHMGSTVGLGGFSTRDAGFAAFDSPAIEAVAVIFMLIAGINFATHFSAFRSRSLEPYRGSSEVRSYVLVLLLSVVLMTAFLWLHQVYPTFGSALRHALFNTVSVATTTGFVNTDYSLWPVFAPVFMLGLSCFVTSAGSTGGGIKMVRMIILVKQARREFVRLLHPRSVSPVRLNGKAVDNNVIFSVMAFVLLYMGSLVVLSMAMLFTGLDAVSAFTAVMASLNSTGPGLGVVGPASTYAVLTDAQTWICTIAMLLGRLELFSVLVLFTPGFWKK
ncbi:MAG: potassium transporter TrkG [Pigmentiphaga sp.]